MIEVKHNRIESFAGDSETMAVALYKRGVIPSFWGTASNLIFTAKLSPDDTDEEAVIQKTTGAGITENASVAKLDIVPYDTVEQEDVTLYCQIRGESVADGTRHTGATWTWKLLKPIVKHTDASITIYTSEPANTTARLLVLANAAIDTNIIFYNTLTSNLEITP